MVTTFGMLLAALGYMDETVPDKSGPGVAVTVLAIAAFWIFGGLWMGYRSRWGWAIAFWLALPMVLPLYVYKASRGTAGTSGNRFPVFRSAGANGLLAVALFFATESLATRSSGPKTVDTDDTPSAIASPVALGPASPRTWFDPELITHHLLHDSFHTSIQTGCEDYDAERWDEEYWGAYANVAQECDFGGIAFIVFETNSEADEAVVELQGQDLTSLPGYSRYETAAWFDEDFASYYVAIGNVVVAASAGEDWIAETGYEEIYPSPESAAEALATQGIERLIALGGAPPGTAGTAM